jgi:hypothetical protein
MIRIITAVFVFLLVATVSILGFGGDTTRREPLILFPDMDRQAKITPQAESGFYDNRMGDRLPPMNYGALVAMPWIAARFLTNPTKRIGFAMWPCSPGNMRMVPGCKAFPMEVNREMMLLGRERVRHLLHGVPWRSRRRQRSGAELRCSHAGPLQSAA